MCQTVSIIRSTYQTGNLHVWQSLRFWQLADLLSLPVCQSRSCFIWGKMKGICSRWVLFSCKFKTQLYCCIRFQRVSPLLQVLKTYRTHAERRPGLGRSAVLHAEHRRLGQLRQGRAKPVVGVQRASHVGFAVKVDLGEGGGHPERCSP